MVEQAKAQDLAESHPWTLPWWKVEGENSWTLAYIVTVHVGHITPDGDINPALKVIGQIR